MPPFGLRVRAWENFGCRQLPASYQGSFLARRRVAFTEVWSGPLSCCHGARHAPLELPESSAPSSIDFPLPFESAHQRINGVCRPELPPKEEKEADEDVTGFGWNCMWCLMGFPGGAEVKASVCNVGDQDSIPGSGRSPEEENCNPLHYSCLENPMDRGAWYSTVHRAAKSRTTERLHFHFFQCCQKTAGTNNALPAHHQDLGAASGTKGRFSDSGI